MREKFTVMIGFVLILFAAGCDKPSTADRDLANKNGTERTFAADQGKTTSAVKAAFDELRHHSMMIEPVDASQSTADWHVTNGFLLIPTTEPVSFVSLKKGGETDVPYFGTFHIAINSMGTNLTKVTVTTIRAKVIIGKTVNVHGGWANRYREIPPVRREEENVLNAIASKLADEKMKNTK